MKELKVHLFDPRPENGMPAHMLHDFVKKGERGTLCGFIRRFTYVVSEVTCKDCLRLINQGDSK